VTYTGVAIAITVVMVLSGLGNFDHVSASSSKAQTDTFSSLCPNCLSDAQLESAPASAIGQIPFPSVNGLDFHGVDRSGQEYACVQGWAIGSGPYDLPSVQAMRTWNVSAVRVPLNEDCWLDINGSPAAYSGAAYRDYIVNFTMLLQSQGIRPILDLHWNNASTGLANQQQPMADQDHSPAFWASVASTFKNDPAVIFDLYNEPWGISWACWDHGCMQTVSGPDFETAGMQELVNVTRAAGARDQLIMLGGLNWANDLSDFLNYLPIDPAGPGHLAASIHLYDGENCDTATCWDSTIKPILNAGIPVIVGELGEGDCNPTFIRSFFSWADPLGIPFLGWAWTTYDTCSGPTLIANYSGTPYMPYGAGFKEELLNFSAGPMLSPPYAPESLKATPGTGSVQLNWNAPTLDGNLTITNYTVLYGPTAVGFDQSMSVGSASTTADVTGLSSGVNYTFAVEAWNSQGVSPWSSNVSATPHSGPASQTNAGTVKSTLCLFNNTLLPGKGVCPEGLDPSAAAFDTLTGEIYVANSNSNNVSVISNGKVISFIPVGDEPYGIAYDSGNGYIYVANSGSNNVSVISGNRVIKSIPAGSGPYAVVYDSDDTDVYVTNGGGTNVSVISGLASAGVSIHVGTYPQGVTYDSSNGEIFVTNYLTHNVSVICGTAVGCGTLNSLVTASGVGNYPFGAVFDSINGEVYVANSGSDNVTVLCGLAIGCGTFNKAVANIGMGYSPYGAAFDTISGNVFITNEESNNVSVICGVTGISCTQNKVIVSTGVGSAPMGVAYDTTTGDFYTTNSLSNNVTVISGTTNKVVTNIVLGVIPGGPATDSINGDIYVPISNTNNVSVVSGTTDRIITNISVGLDPVEAVFDSGNRYVYITNEGDNNVSVINTTTQSVVASVSVGDNPWGLAYDQSNGYVYVTNTNSNNVTVVDGSTNKVVTSIWTGATPMGAAYDPSSECLYVSNEVAGNVSVVNTTTSKVTSSFVAFFYPVGITYSPLDREIYVAISNGGSVGAVSGSTIVQSIAVLGAPYAVDFDSANGYVYATDSSSPYVSVINDKNGVIANISVGLEPMGVAFDSSNANVYVTNHNSASVSIIGPPTYNATFTESGLPSGTSWGVSMNGSLATSTTSAVTFSEMNGTYLFTVGAVPGYAANPASGSLKVSGANAGKTIAFTRMLPGRYSVTFNESGLPTSTSWSVDFNGTTNTSTTSSIVINNVVNKTGGYSFSVIAVAGYTASPSSGSITVNGGNAYKTITFTPVSPGTYTVTFNEQGLPAGTNWSVVFNTSTIFSTSSAIVINDVLNNTNGYSYTVNSVAGYTASPSSGSVVVNGADESRTITFTPLSPGRYTVTFEETGLPSGTSWSVIMNGATNSSATSSIIINDLLNDTYPFTVGTVAGYTASPQSGSVVVNGGDVVKDIQFTSLPPGRYSVAFTETGLPSGTSWSVTINGATNTSVTATMIINDLVNNTYPFTVGAVAGYTASPQSGNIVVSGSDVSKGITFTPLPPGRYSMTFSETGLPGNTNWSVTFNGTPSASATSSIIINDLANGNYSYTVGEVAGYTANQTTGSITINGASASRTIAFTKSSTGGGSGTSNTFLGLPGFDGYLLLIGIVAVVAVVGAILIMRRKGRKPKAATPQQPSAPEKTPTPQAAPAGTAAPPPAAPPSPAQQPSSPPPAPAPQPVSPPAPPSPPSLPPQA
jgi:YVTN family beta-propeller protein